jgi:hypothetical protein
VLSVENAFWPVCPPGAREEHWRRMGRMYGNLTVCRLTSWHPRAPGNRGSVVKSLATGGLSSRAQLVSRMAVGRGVGWDARCGRVVGLREKGWGPWEKRVTAAGRKPTVDPREAVTIAGRLQNRKVVRCLVADEEVKQIAGMSEVGSRTSGDLLHQKQQARAGNLVLARVGPGNAGVFGIRSGWPTRVVAVSAESKGEGTETERQEAATQAYGA